METQVPLQKYNKSTFFRWILAFFFYVSLLIFRNLFFPLNSWEINKKTIFHKWLSSASIQDDEHSTHSIHHTQNACVDKSNSNSICIINTSVNSYFLHHIQYQRHWNLIFAFTKTIFQHMGFGDFLQFRIQNMSGKQLQRGHGYWEQKRPVRWWRIQIRGDLQQLQLGTIGRQVWKKQRAKLTYSMKWRRNQENLGDFYLICVTFQGCLCKTIVPFSNTVVFSTFCCSFILR